MFWLFKDLANRDDTGRRLLRGVADDAFMASQCFKARRFIKPTVLTDKELQGIKVPTLYLVGENEKIYSAHKAVERLHRIAPSIKTEVIPGGGHALPTEQPEMVNRIVCGFLRG